MKSFSMLAAVAFFISASDILSADDLKDSVRDLNRGIDRLHSEIDRLGKCDDRADGGFSVVSEVNLKCMKLSYDAYPYRPELTTLVQWTESCRTASTKNPDERICLKVSSGPVSECISNLNIYYPYRPDADALKVMTNACARYEYHCDPRMGANR